MTADNLKALKEALYVFAREENEAIERALASSPKPPESLYKKCDEMVEDLLKKQKRRLPIKKAITILIASAILISAFAITAYALRDKIGGFFVDFFEKHAELSTDNTDVHNVAASNVLINYIPIGYTETQKDVSSTTGLYIWRNDKKSISLYYRINSTGSQAIDTENSNYTTVEVGDLTVFRTEKYGQIDATWTDEKMVYILSATGAPWDEMVKIIEGIKVEE